MDGWVNVDVRKTGATDVTADLSTLDIPGRDGAEAFFSHAFFEHVRRDDRLPHLAEVRRSLGPGGFACYLGLPDFPAIARLYLEKREGIVGPVFDLYNVYRYTHGDPEGVEESGWVPQLHKSLFDADELSGLLTKAGFPSYALLSYVFPGEPWPVSLGFYATKERADSEALGSAARQFIAGFGSEYVEPGTLRLVDAASRSELRARAGRSRPRQMLHRVAWGLATRLAKV